MTFEQYWSILIKHWKLVVICFLLVGLGAYLGSKLMKPLYQSSVLVQVVIRSGNNNQADIQNLMASDQLVQTEVTLVVSNQVLGEVASRYPGLSVSQLAGEVSSTVKVNTQLFEIDVVDLSPTRAASLANDIAATLIKQQSQAVQHDDAQARQQIQKSLDQTGKQINDITLKISALKVNQVKGGNQGQIDLLQAQVNELQQQYSQLQTSLTQLELTQAQSENFLRVVQSAQPATSPVRPNILLNTGGGLVAGLLVGMLLALLYERLDRRVRTPEVLIQLLKWPVLATIWRADSSKPENVINPADKDINVESYRILRTNIGFSSLDKPLHSIVVTSPLSHDGKSVIAANLAIFMAKAGKNTLLIDADLRRPTQQIFFNLSPHALGLSNAVLSLNLPTLPSTPSYHLPGVNASTVGKATATNFSLEPFVRSIGIPNLWVMPSGPLPPNPSEFLESKAMQHFLMVIANSGLEVVIFDTPSLLGLSDASILASKVDGALIVVDTTRATKEKLKRMKAVLSQTGIHVIGCVANKLRHNRNDSAIYYYTEDPHSGEKSTSNGHTPSVPTSPMGAEPPFEERMRSN